MLEEYYGKVPGSALEALDLSIRHWEQVAALKNPGEATLGTMHCALCLMFHHDFVLDRYPSMSCKGCPVMATTGQQFCHGSPYINVVNSLGMWAASGHSDSYAINFQFWAKEELEFLRGIRDRMINGSLTT